MDQGLSFARRVPVAALGLVLLVASANGQYFPRGPMVPPNPAPVPVFVRVSGLEKARVVFFGIGGKPNRLDLPATVGLRVLNTYTFALEGLPDLEDRQFFGTIETIGAPLVPACAKTERVPIPIHLTDEDVVALRRRLLLTKILVLEDPATAMPLQTDPDEPVVYDMPQTVDPIRRAKELGLVMLVVRIGDRVLTSEELASIGLVGPLWIGRKLKIQGAQGHERVVWEYLDSETGTSAPTEPVTLAHGRTYCPAGSGQGGCADPGRVHSPGAHSAEVTPGPGAAPPSSPRRPFPLPPPVLSGNFGGADQFLCDGGDRRPRAGIGVEGHLVNVDPSDTVAEYRDGVGTKRIVPSNCVCIYAPRFAEVRFLRGPEGYDARALPDTLAKDRVPARVDQAVQDLAATKYERPVVAHGRRRASGLASEQWKGDFTEVRVLAGYDQGQGWAQTIGAERLGAYHNSLQPFLAARVELARILTQVQSPQILAMVEGVGQVVTVWRHRELREVEQEPKCNHLELEKCASVSEARPGDTVEFTIRYRNVGDLPASHVALVDNLTARLEYVENSARSDRPATFLAETNEVGSHILRWELREPLEPGAAGEVRFQTKVR